MKKEKIEEPKEYFERSTSFLVVIAAVSLVLDVLCLYFLKEVSVWGNLLMAPAIISSILSLSIILNPYALLFDDRFELKKNIMFNKDVYFLDLKGIRSPSKNKLFVVYNDGEEEKVPLFGMKDSHKELFKQRLTEKIKESLEKRNF